MKAFFNLRDECTSCPTYLFAIFLERRSCSADWLAKFTLARSLHSDDSY